MFFRKHMLLTIVVSVILLVLSVYGLMFFFSRKKHSVDFGVSFNQNHAAYLGSDWKKNYLDMLDELKPKYIRLSTMWNEIERTKGQYDFVDTDWMMKEAWKRGVKVTLVVGQKVPRWPECYLPPWAVDDKENYQDNLLRYIATVVTRYRNNEALEIWQVENEPYIDFEFGSCKNFDQSLVEEEISLVKTIDKNHQVLVTDSGELSSWSKAIKASDMFGTTMYRVVGDSKFGFYFNYDWLPAAFYRWKAKIYGRKINTVYISELQAEPWFMVGDVYSTTIAEQEKSMNVDRLKKNIDYAKKVGFSRAYLWGVEWWYYMKDKNGDDRYWNLVKEVIEKKGL